MTTTDSIGIFNMSTPAPLAFPTLFEPKAFKGRNGKLLGEPKFGGTILFEPDSPELKDIKTTMGRVARAEWPGVSFSDVTFPHKSGTELADARKAQNAKLEAEGQKLLPDGEFQRGKVVLKARSKFQPRLSGFENGRIVDYADPAAITQSKPKFYFGVEVLAQFNFVAMEVDGTKFVAAYLNRVMTTGKGKKIGDGGQSSADVFKGYRGSTSTEDPTAGVDDEIPY